MQVGKGRILMEGERVALLGYGSAVQYCVAASSIVEEHGLRVTVADARFCKPLDHALIRSLAKSHEVIITVEEGSIGGFGSHVAQFMALDGLLDGKLKVISNQHCSNLAITHLTGTLSHITVMNSVTLIMACVTNDEFFLLPGAVAAGGAS